MSNQETVIINLAINDNNGNWDYKIRRAEFGNLIDANAQWRPAQAEIKDDTIYIGYVSAKVLRRINWYGSMAFEGIEVSIDDAQRIAEYLRERGYTPGTGDGDVWDAWDNNQPIIFADAETPDWFS